jgi:hypothetical protein
MARSQSFLPHTLLPDHEFGVNYLYENHAVFALQPRGAKVIVLEF